GGAGGAEGLRGRRRAAVAAEARAAIGGRGRNDSRRRVDAPDAVVSIGDEDVARGVEGDAVGVLELRGRRRPAVAAEARTAIARHGRNGSRRRVDAPDAVVLLISDEQVSCRAEGNAGGEARFGPGGRTAVAAEARTLFASHGGNNPGCCLYKADAVVRPVGNCQVARSIHRNAKRKA